MADGPSAEDASAELGDGDSRVTRERHKRQDASSSSLSTSTSLSTGQDAARRVHEEASTLENHYHNPPRRNCHAHAHPHLHRRHHNSNNHHHHYHHNSREDERICKENGGGDGGGGGGGCGGGGGGGAGGDTTCVLASTSPTGNGLYGVEDDEEEEDDEEDEEDEDEEEDDKEEEVEDEDEEEEEDEEDEEDEDEEEVDDEVDEGEESSVDVSDQCRAGVRIEIPKTVEDDESSSNSTSGADSAAMTGISSSRNIEDTVSSCNARRTRPTGTATNTPSQANETSNRATDVNEPRQNDERENFDNVNLHPRIKKADGDVHNDAKIRAGVDDDDDAPKTLEVTAGCGSGGGGGRCAAAAAAVSASGVAGAAAVPISVPTSATANGLVAVRHQGSPFKGQVRTAEDTLVGPCGKKRCADRYDSSESSDSGVAVSCGECSSSGTSDITEPGSPCSTSSDEGVAIRAASASPLPSLPKLAPSSHITTRPQWPWTPPLAATACSTYKRLKGEPEAGALPRSGAADPTSRGTGKTNGKANIGHHHHESQGKITEYFKTQIKPQQPKIKKTSEAMSVLVAKSTSEFRRPPTVQRNKGGLAKYLGAVSPNGRGTTTNDWEVRTLTMSPPPTKKPPPVIVPRSNGKLEKKLPKPMPSLPISNDVLKNLPGCKISSLRLTSEASPNPKSSPPPSTPAPTLTGDSVTLDFKGCILAKPHVNENNNLTNGCAGILGSLRSQTSQDPLSRLSVPEDVKTKETQIAQIEEDDVEEEEEDSRSSESKPPLSPILSAPTTIRFPAREPEKDRQQTTDSGICRWDKCEASFESSGGLLEHLQAAHINTQTGGDNFVCQWQGCKVQGRSSCSRRWLERHVLSHAGNKPFRCIVDGCGTRFSSQTALERHVNGHFNQPETSSSSGRRSCENGGKLVRRNGKRLRYRRQPWSARLFDYFDSGVMEGLQHRLLELAKSRTQGRLAETPGNSMALTSQVLARRVELDGKAKVLLRWYPQDIEPDEWVLESEVQSTKHVGIRKVASSNPEEVSLALYPAVSGGTPPLSRVKQRRKPVKNS